MRKLLPLAVVIGLVLAACQPSASSPGASPSQAPASAGPFTGMTYPEKAPADCAYNGEMSQIKAVDRLTVEFTLCYPDPAFLSKIAFTTNAILDSDYLAANMANHLILARPNGTGAYQVDAWQRGSQLVLSKFDNYWGEAGVGADQLVFTWTTQSAARLVALQSGSVDGIDNPAPNDFATIQADPNLQLIPRAALSTFYLGFTNTFEPWDDVLVRRAIAQGIDRQRIVDQFYPGGSTVADYFTPCEITYGCVGDPWYSFDPVAAKASLAEAGFPDGFSTVLNYRDVVRGYLPDPGVVAQDIQAQLKANLNIDITIEVQESGTFLDNAANGNLQGLYMLGWGADYPDQTNFLDYHFNNPGNLQFGVMPASVTDAIRAGATTLDATAREAAYVEANNAIRDFVPMVPVAHGASATAWKADVVGAHSSPLGNEYFGVVDPGGRAQMVWMQNAEPISLYCADETDGETLRLCEQVTESLYAYETGGTAPIPALATECTGNADATVWTCTLHDGVLFQGGESLDANDVVVSLALQWDNAHPLHIGRGQGFGYWAGLFGNYLNAE